MISVEQIMQDFKTCRNELCCRCGKYTNEHMGACDGCRWHNYNLGESENAES